MIGYAVERNPVLASYRLRVDLPRQHLGVETKFGIGAPTFFYKDGNAPMAWLAKPGGVVYDVVNDHLEKPSYKAMVAVADVMTCASEVMAETIHRKTGRDAIVIDDPYENDESPAACEGDEVLWFGHSANLDSLVHYLGVDELVVCCNTYGIKWTVENEAECLRHAAVVLLTGSNPGASTNRVVKAIRAGRFVVMPHEAPESWKVLEQFVWIGDVRRGVAWALNNREEACHKVQQGQKYIAERYHPRRIAEQWMAVFGSISGSATKSKRDG